MFYAVLLLVFSNGEPLPIMRYDTPFTTYEACNEKLDTLRHEFSPYYRSQSFPALECQYFADEEKVAL